MITQDVLITPKLKIMIQNVLNYSSYTYIDILIRSTLNDNEWYTIYYNTAHFMN